MYREQFLETLHGGGVKGIYAGDVELSDLRTLYHQLYQVFRTTSIHKDGTVWHVQLSEVDEDYVKMRTMECLELKRFRVGNYSKEEITKTICDHVQEINIQILKDNKEDDELAKFGSVKTPDRFSVSELRKANFLG